MTPRTPPLGLATSPCLLGMRCTCAWSTVCPAARPLFKYRFVRLGRPRRRARFAIVVFFGCGDRLDFEKPLHFDHVRICLYALKAPQSVDRSMRQLKERPMKYVLKSLAFVGLAGMATTGAYAEPLKIALVETLSGGQAVTGKLFQAAIIHQSVI